MVALLVDKEKLYNWFPNIPEATTAIDAFCAIASDFCIKLMDMLVDETVDNVPRFEAMMTSTTSG